jgi:two-component system, OmpR family, phosphate regulon sensor histidine kinase PhoR
MLKNITPKQIALYSAIILSFISFLIISAGILLDFIDTKWYVALLFWAVTFLISYFLIVFILKRFIYRKIKLIYKNIHEFKLASKKGLKNIDLDKDVLEEVEQEVAQWADSQKKEIESLKLLEQYRRDFLGNISHELKTPIFSIQGYIHTLLDGALYDKDINENYLRKAAKNVARLLTIVEDLESISRLESGKMVLDIQPFDIRELVSEVFEDLELQAKERHISLFIKESTDRSFLVVADRENIRQVLVNLLSNSIKYGKENGQTKVGFYDMEKYILVEVADNGIGIGEDHIKHLFDRFYRVDKSRSRSRGGSGLGLSIVKHIIEAHNQTINARSSIGVGSTFGFTLKKA